MPIWNQFFVKGRQYIRRGTTYTVEYVGKHGVTLINSGGTSQSFSYRDFTSSTVFIPIKPVINLYF